MRLALLASLLLGCGSSPPPDKTVPEDLELDEGPWAARDPGKAPPPRDVEPADAAPQPALRVEVISDPGESLARIDLAVRDAPVRDVLRMIATAANVSLVAGDDVTGSVTLDVDNVTWRQAIDVIAHLEGLTVEELDGVLLIKKAEAKP